MQHACPGSPTTRRRFAPWIAFWVIASGPSTWLHGAIAALIIALILLIPDVARRSPKILDMGTIAFFVALVIAGIALNARDGDWLDRYSNPISTGVLASSPSARWRSCRSPSSTPPGHAA